MFTGLVECLGEVVEVRNEPPGRRLTVRAGAVAADAELGASVAINGCCLTVVERQGDSLHFEAGPETLQRTNLGRATIGTRVNLERSLKLGDRMGGHLVTGHVDGVGQLLARNEDGPWVTCWFSLPATLARQLASKGSIAVDGVSLTLVDVLSDRFSVALIPHTLDGTTLGALRVGDLVNIETDLIAKYVEQQMRGKTDEPLQHTTPDS